MYTVTRRGARDIALLPFHLSFNSVLPRGARTVAAAAALPLLQYKRWIVALDKTKVAGMFAAQSIG